MLAGCKRRIIKRDEPCADIERDFEEQARAAEEGRRALGSDSGDPRTADALLKKAHQEIELICRVATRSSNLKGTFVHALKDAAASIQTVVEALKERTASDEVRKLQLENTHLRSEMQELKLQMEELRYQHREPFRGVEGLHGGDDGLHAGRPTGGIGGVALACKVAPTNTGGRQNPTKTVLTSAPKKKKKPAPKTASASEPESNKRAPKTALTAVNGPLSLRRRRLRRRRHTLPPPPLLRHRKSHSRRQRVSAFSHAPGRRLNGREPGLARAFTCTRFEHGRRRSDLSIIEVLD
ncbi:unnamed protein product [Euphydryas editha]|uniref:Uncharacterized protein n=1 Tax=Euphydryas editha TaxID=104508 RepID=A0AAU9UV17_EUPED|nr:unnamed protein product [Euphydryas editha]